MKQYIAHATDHDGRGIGISYVVDTHGGGSGSYYARAYVGRGLARNVTRYQAWCQRCKWSQRGFLRKTEATAAFKSHNKERHGNASARMKPTYWAEGHCIRHAGARYTEHVDRLLRPFEEDEPVHRVADGIGRKRLRWLEGRVSFAQDTEAVPPRCPAHDEPLKFFEMWLTHLDGQPASHFTNAVDDRINPPTEALP